MGRDPQSELHIRAVLIDVGAFCLDAYSNGRVSDLVHCRVVDACLSFVVESCDYCVVKLFVHILTGIHEKYEVDHLRLRDGTRDSGQEPRVMDFGGGDITVPNTR